MKYTLYIADRKINNFMEAADLKGNHKVFISSCLEVDSKTVLNGTEEKFFMNIINNSKDDKENDFWIPMVFYEDKNYIADGIQILSDGKKEMFIAVSKKESVEK